MNRLKDILFSNRSMRQTIAKNTFWMTFGTFVGRLLRSLFLIVVARALGATDLGPLVYILSLASLFTVFIDLGINGIITRESSKDLSLQERYFSTALAIKVAALIGVSIVVLGILPHTLGHAEILPLIPLMLLIIVFDSMRDFGALITRAWERMHLEAFVQLFTNVMIVVFGAVALYFSHTAHAVAIGYAIGAGLGLIPAYYPLRHFLPNIRKTFRKELVLKILAASWPYGMLGLMGAVMLNSDTIMIGWYRSLTDVGLYGAVQRIALFVYLIPGPLAIAVFPSMAKHVDNAPVFRRILEQSLALFTLVGVPLTVASVLLQHQIVGLVYGAGYASTALTYALMSLAYIPFFYSTVLGNAVFAFKEERKLFVYAMIGIFGNILLNVLLIPVWGIAGSALGTAINQVIITWYLVYRVRKHVSFSIFGKLKSIAGAAVAMGLVFWGFSFFSPSAYLTLAVGLIVYAGGLYFLKDPTTHYLIDWLFLERFAAIPAAAADAVGDVSGTDLPPAEPLPPIEF